MIRSASAASRFAFAVSIPFLIDALAEPLPLHRAEKEIPCLDAEGSLRPVPGVKFERFLFDIFPRADDITVVEIAPKEFSPLKNALGPYSLTTVQAALEEQYARWYTDAGVFPPDERPLELSPLDAIGPDDLRPKQADG